MCLQNIQNNGLHKKYTRNIKILTSGDVFSLIPKHFVNLTLFRSGGNHLRPTSSENRYRGVFAKDFPRGIKSGP